MTVYVVYEVVKVEYGHELKFLIKAFKYKSVARDFMLSAERPGKYYEMEEIEYED